MIGERIAEERKRIGMSQADFAKAIGVSLSSQKRYEKGEISPNSDYLKSLDNIGVDAFFVLHGDTSGEIRHEILGIGASNSGYGGYRNEALGILLSSLGVDPDAWNKSLEKILPISVEANRYPDSTRPAVCVDATGGARLVSELVSLSPVLSEKVRESSEIFLSLLSDVIEGLENAVRASGKDIQPAKKAQAVVMLCRAFKASGTVDQKMIEEAVKLAAD